MQQGARLIALAISCRREQGLHCRQRSRIISAQSQQVDQRLQRTRLPDPVAGGSVNLLTIRHIR